MNDTQIRAAFPVPAEPFGLDAKIDRALARAAHARGVRRQVAFGTAATAALAVAFVVGPAVQAQAALSGIVHALDRQTHARITKTTVDDGGRPVATSTVVIADGDVAIRNARGEWESIDQGGKSYNLDSTVGAYIVSARRAAPGLRLSDMLGPGGGFSVGKRATVERGEGVLRATIENTGLPERYVVEADPKTELPFAMRIESRERGAWRVRERIAFDYAAAVAVPKPDLERYPAMTFRQAENRFAVAMTAGSLGEVPLRRGRVVLRAVDVAEDGSVFVCLQTGDRALHNWKGANVELKDDRGTKYVPAGGRPTDGETLTADGKFEFELFVPAEPIPAARPRTLTLTTHRNARTKALVRMMEWFERRPDGSDVRHWGPNVWAKGDDKPETLTLATLRFAGATCGARPAWAARMDFTGFRNDPAARLTLADARGTAALKEKDWATAARWFEEELRRMDEHERQGFGSWSRERVLKDLDTARAGESGATGRAR